MPEQKHETKFSPDDVTIDADAVLIKDDGTEGKIGKDSGVLLRGEDLEQYKSGEEVTVPGLGRMRKGEKDFVRTGLVRTRNTSPDSPAARSETAFRRGDIDENPVDEEDSGEDTTNTGG